MAEGIVAALRRNLGPNTTDHVSTGADGELLLDFTRLTREQAAAICELIDR